MSQRRRVPVGGKSASVEPSEGSAPESCDCPRLDADEWHEVESDWTDITFLKASTSAVLGVPVGYDSTREDLRNRAVRIGASVPDDAMLLMGEGRFRRALLLEVEDVPNGARGVERPGGIAFSRLVPAPWGQMKRVVEETIEVAKARYRKAPDDIWLWYLTCRICSKERGFETLVIAHYREHV